MSGMKRLFQFDFTAGAGHMKMPPAYLDLLADLIRIPSVNPMGKSPVRPPLGEAQLSDFVHDRFHELGMQVERQKVEPGRENVVACLNGSTLPNKGGQSLLIDVHLDTVGVEGMTIEPFTPRQEDGRMYGRGACDVKGSLAVVIHVLDRLIRERPPEMPTVFVACTVNEENGFSGARRVARSWTEGDSALLTHPPSAILVAEPTELNIVTSHKGVVRWRCQTTGRAAHSSQPEAGQNAIYRMSRVVGALERYAGELAGKRPPHPLVGQATLSVGTITGGIEVNTVPDRCCVEIDRRLLPDEDPIDAAGDVRRYVEAAVDADDRPVHEEPYLAARGLDAQHNGPLAGRLQKIASRIGVSSRQIGASYATDASIVGATGIPTVVFGPGSIDQAHTADEWIAVEQLRLAAEILFEFCSGDPPAIASK
jgi:acetylornithine deacetylase/succinyl-diaminopimelate desuccinylase family protein